MGDLHPEIVFLGDTVDTTARIEAASGELHRDVLASRDLVDRLPGLPAGVVSVALGPIALRARPSRWSCAPSSGPQHPPDAEDRTGCAEHIH